MKTKKYKKDFDEFELESMRKRLNKAKNKKERKHVKTMYRNYSLNNFDDEIDDFKY